MSKSFHIYLDSRDRTTGSITDSSYTLQTPQVSANLLAVSVESVIIPNLEYSINSHNNKLYFKENGGSLLTANIATTNYTGTQLATEIQTKMNAIGTLNYTINYDSQAKTLEFSVILPDTFQLIFDEPNSISSVIGFQADSPIGAFIESEFPIRIDGAEYVDLVMSGTRTENIHSSGRSNTLARIPILEQFGGVVYYLNPNNHNFAEISKDLFYRIRLSFIKPNGRIFELPDTAHISVVLRCEAL